MKSLHDSLIDPDLFGKTFGGETFKAWRTVAKVLDAAPLDADELTLYQTITGRTVTPTEPIREAYFVKPRRSGGTLFLAAIGLHAAIQDYRARLGPGEVATVALVASDRKQAGQLMNYVKGLIADAPIISAEVVGMTKESIEFAHRVNLEIHVGSFRSTRGYSYACVLLDELAFYRDDLSANPDVELVRAVRPGLTNLRGRLIGSSSPHARRGHLFDMHKAHYGRDGDRVLVIQAPGRLLNPTIAEETIEQARAEDAVAARSEWDAQFREDIAQYLDDALLDAAIVAGRRSMPRKVGTTYTAWVDPSGGRSDSMTCGISHRDVKAGRVILDKLVIVPAPFDPEEATVAICEALAAYGLDRAMADSYAGEWPQASFQRHGVTLEFSERSASEVYSEALVLFTQGLVELLDVPRLRTELSLLERRPRAGGRGDLIDHAPRAHDDAAVACCGSLLLASRLQADAPGNDEIGHARIAYDPYDLDRRRA